jgi:competence protein ComEA
MRPLSIFFASFFLSAALFAQKAQLPDAAGKDTVQRVCLACHGPELIVGKGNTRDGWNEVVAQMISRGAQGSDDDFATIVDYLTTNLPPHADVKKVNVNKAAAAELASGLQISDKDAGAILDYRKQNGDFKSLADLKKVPGIDAAKLDSVKDRIAFE